MSDNIDRVTRKKPPPSKPSATHAATHAKHPSRPVSELGFTQAAKVFQRHGRSANLSPNTLEIRDYTYSYFARWLEINNRSLDVLAITRDDIHGFLDFQKAQGYADTTVRTRYLNLHVLFNWLVEEGELERSPCDRMATPAIAEHVTPLLSDAQVKALIAACEGKTFDDRRDMAIVRLLLDTGLRRGELIGILLEDINWDERTILIRGKGKLDREIAFGRKTDAALSKYMMARERHKYREMPNLWLTFRGAMYKDTVRWILERRAKAAGLGHIWPHLLRHMFSHLWLAGGGQERSLMKLNGWRSPAMLERYGSQLAAKRAQDEHRRMSPGDRF